MGRILNIILATNNNLFSDTLVKFQRNQLIPLMSMVPLNIGFNVEHKNSSFPLNAHQSGRNKLFI